MDWLDEPDQGLPTVGVQALACAVLSRAWRDAVNEGKVRVFRREARRFLRGDNVVLWLDAACINPYALYDRLKELNGKRTRIVAIRHRNNHSE